MADATEETITRIQEKLAKAHRGSYRSFGSDRHQFKLNRRLSEEAVAQFESVHRIHLPEGYRRFLIAAGNGGAGPYYGILPLEKWDRILPDDRPDAIAKPSPLRPGANGLPLDGALGPHAEELFQGAITLNEQGDSYYGLLIVTGKFRGSVVYVDADASCPIHFVSSDFLAWYEDWLDLLLSGQDTRTYGFPRS